MLGAWVVCTCVRSCVRAWCCVWRGWRWLTSFDLTFDVPTGTVGRQSLPRSQSAFGDIFHVAQESGRGVVALSTANHFAMTPRRSPPPRALCIALAKTLKGRSPGTLNYTCVKRATNWRCFPPFQDRLERALLVSTSHREVTSLWSVETRRAHSERSGIGGKHF